MAKKGNHLWIHLEGIQFKRRVKAELPLANPISCNTNSELRWCEYISTPLLTGSEALGNLLEIGDFGFLYEYEVKNNI